MTRLVSLVLAVIAGLGAALLSSTSPTVHAEGRSATCTALLVRFENGERVGSDPRPTPSSNRESIEARLARACDDKEDQWAVLAGLASLVSLVAGSIALVRRTDEVAGQPADMPTRV